jgi:hypothetical protein
MVENVTRAFSTTLDPPWLPNLALNRLFISFTVAEVSGSYKDAYATADEGIGIPYFGIIPNA